MRPRLLALLLLAPLVAGCATPWSASEDEPWYPDRTEPEPRDPGPPLVWGGRVLDATSGEPLANATLRLDLARVIPCARQGLGWAQWAIPVHQNGTFGPYETPTPRSDEVAFFLHATAPGYAPHVVHVGPSQAQQGLRDLSIDLQPNATLEGRAPPGTVLALDAPGFPRLVAADAEGAWRFTHARVEEAQLVAATEPPTRTRVHPPATLDVAPPAENATAWNLEGRLRTSSGAPLAGDVVAWNGTQLWSVARANDVGTFTLPLPAEPAPLRIEARTHDGRHGGALTLTLNGPPATVETVLMRPRC